MAADTDDAFRQLNDAELAALRQFGVRRAVAAGEYLYREGDSNYDFYVVLAGAVEIVVNAEGKDRVIARHPAGRFLGELNLLTGQRVFVSARVAEPGEVLAVPRDAFRRLIATDASLSDKILAAFLARRAILMTDASWERSMLTAPVRDQPSGVVRRRRRPLRFDQTSRGRGRGRLGGRSLGPRLSGLRSSCVIGAIPIPPIRRGIRDTRHKTLPRFRRM